MGNIVLLDEHTVNKIAAGEVVDRPSSIVKELVENSIDAKASNITVEIKSGGISYIKIVDDGTGISSDDVEIAFERHATSKIRKEEDLHTIKTMGFRGEALASVAAISKVSLITRHISEKIGTKIQVEAGKVLNIEQTASKQGTSIIITDVFFNVPARFKFLKKDYTEAGYIEDVMLRLSLINPHISFKYINNGKLILQTNGNTDLKTAVFSVFGKEVYQNIEDVEYTYQNITVKGVVGTSKLSRSSRNDQYTYINGRYIKNKTITAAIDEAYSEELAINKFAFAILNIEINPGFVDVNVHPAKLEVKFENENTVFDAVYAAVKNTLKKHNIENSPFSQIIYNSSNVELKDYRENDEKTKIEEKKISLTQILSGINSEYTLKNIDLVKSQEEAVAEKEKTVYGMENSFVPYITEKQEEIELINKDIESNSNFHNNENIKSEKINEAETVIPYKYVGAVFDTYIIIQINDKMYIIDQHAAHERLIYEAIKKRYYSTDRQTQMLLIPIIIELKNKEKDIIKYNLQMFEKIGYVIEDFGSNTIKIAGVPNIGYDIDFKSMLIDTIDEIMGQTRTETTEKEFRFLATLACKAAVKANMKLTKEEHISLVNDMMKLDRPFTCPHGRPTAYEISRYEIERRFLRK